MVDPQVLVITPIANGVLFEIAYAHELGKAVRLYTVANLSSEIRPAPIERLKFESELYGRDVTRDDLRRIVEGLGSFPDGRLRLFDLDQVDARQPKAIDDIA